MFKETKISSFFSVLAVFFTVLVVARLFHLQVIEGPKYKSFVKSQVESKIETTRNRGTIFDRDGEVLAQNKVVGSIYAFRKNIRNIDTFINQLEVNGIEVSKRVRDQLESNDGFIWIERHLDLELAEYLKSNITGLEYYKEEARHYPEGTSMSNLLGFTGIDNQGRGGIEYTLDSELAGDQVTVVSIKDSRGRLILFDDKSDAILPDSSVDLTVSAKLQAGVESILRNGAKNYGAKNGTAIALDVKTGEVVFAANVRDFNPHDYSGKERSHYNNMPFTYLFEPGSIFKTILFAFMQDKLLIDHQKKYNTSKMINLGGFTYTDTIYRPSLTPEEIYKYSSNIGIAKMVESVNKEAYHKFIVNAGFGEKTGIYGLREESGLVKPPKKWSQNSKTSMSIGYELLVTPIQIVNFYAAIGNNGVINTPKLIDKIEVKSRVVNPEVLSRRIMSESTSDYLLSLMVKTVKTGTGKNARSNIVDIAGKTGTSKKYDPRLKRYSDENYIATFAGVFPSNDPKIAMIVVYDSPSTSIYGGATSAHIFKQIAEYLAVELNLLNRSRVIIANVN